MSRRRLWLFRLAAISLPLVVVVSLEGLLRLAGAYADRIWENPHVCFETGTPIKPEWDAAVAMPKPAGLFRIVTLGGSTTMGYGVQRSFTDRLAQRLAGRRVEVLNGGVGAIGSHRVFEVFKRAAAFDLDMAVVYCGHNEFLEDVFFDPEGLLAHAESIRRFGHRLRVVHLLRDLLPTDVLVPKQRLQRHFFGNGDFPLIRSGEQYSARLQFLAANVRDMIGFAESHEIALVLVPAIPNLLQPPGDSLHGAGYLEQRTAWDATWAEARDAFDAGQYRRAEQLLAWLHQIDDQYAASHFLLARVLLEQQRDAAALGELLWANLLDRRGDRSNQQIIEILLREGRQHGVPTVDLRPQFFASLAEEYRRLRQAGGAWELFLDHCHPSEQGHELIAAAVVEVILGVLPSLREPASGPP